MLVCFAFVAQLLVLEAVNLTDVYPTYQSEGCAFFNDLDTSAVDNLDAAFSSSNLLCDGQSWNWDVSRVTSMNAIFSFAYNFNADISSWDVRRVTEMYFTFWFSSSFNGNIGSWDVSQVDTMHETFSTTNAFNGDISDWDVSRVIGLYNTFYDAVAFNADLSRWDVSQVAVLHGTFFRASAFDGDLRSWCTTAAIDHVDFANYTACIEPIWGTCPTGTSTAPTLSPTSTPTTTPTPTPTATPTAVPTSATSIGSTCDSLILPNAPNGTSLQCGASDTQGPNPNGGGGVGDVVSPVVSIILLDSDGDEIDVSDLGPDEEVVFVLMLAPPSSNSTDQQTIVKRVSDPCRDNKAACAWWDGDRDSWSFDGCTTIEQEQQQFQCRCTHLTEFALVVRAVDTIEPVCGVPNPSPGHTVVAVLYGLAGVAACLQAARLAVAVTNSKNTVRGAARLMVQHIGMVMLCVVRVVVLVVRVAPPRPSAALLVALASVGYMVDVLLFTDLVWTFLAAFLSMKEELLGRLRPMLLMLCGVIVTMLMLLSILVAVLPLPTKVHVATAGSYIMASIVGLFSLGVLVSGMTVVRVIRSGESLNSKESSVAPKLAWCTILLSLSLALGSVCWVLSIQRPLQTSAASRSFALTIEIIAYALGLFNVVLMLYLRFAAVNARAPMPWVEQRRFTAPTELDSMTSSRALRLTSNTDLTSNTELTSVTR